MPGSKITTIDITYQSIFRVIAVGLLLIALFYLREIITALIFAMVVASGIEPGVQWFRRYRVPRIMAVLIMYLVAIAILAGVVYLVVPSLLDEFKGFLDSFPSYQRTLLQELRSFKGLPLYSLFSENAESIILNPPFDLQTVGSGTLSIILTIFGGVVSAIVLIVVSFYLASIENGIEHFLRLITPLRDEEYVIDLWERSQKKMGQWLRGQAILGLIVGVFVFIALTLLGIRYALSLALLAAVFELIPVIGPILAAAPAVFLAFLSSPLLGVIVALVYFIIQQAESHLLVPLVMRRTTGLNPIVVIIALLVGAELGGILGIFLSVPVATIIVEFLTDTDRKKRGLFHYGAPQEPSGP